MGLDMYLIAEVEDKIDYSQDWSVRASRVEKQKLSYFPYAHSSTNCHPVKHRAVVAYWRKANAIHQWFVDNVQSGVDDCNAYEVSRADLQALLSVVNAILSTASKGEPQVESNPPFPDYTTYPNATLDVELAARTLPTRSGFFFGPTEYDHWYIQDLELTKEQLDGILNNYPDDHTYSFEYQASW